MSSLKLPPEYILTPEQLTEWQPFKARGLEARPLTREDLARTAERLMLNGFRGGKVSLFVRPETSDEDIAVARYLGFDLVRLQCDCGDPQHHEPK